MLSECSKVRRGDQLPAHPPHLSLLSISLPLTPHSYPQGILSTSLLHRSPCPSHLKFFQPEAVRWNEDKEGAVVLLQGKAGREHSSALREAGGSEQLSGTPEGADSRESPSERQGKQRKQIWSPFRFRLGQPPLPSLGTLWD